MTRPHRARVPRHVLLVALSTALLVAACGGQAGDPESETPSVEGDATSGSDTPEETTELPAESPRALGVGATFGDLVAAVRHLDGLGQSESAAGCLLRGGSLAPFHLEADLASAVHPIPDAPRELEARLDDPRDTAVVLTRWAQHGQTGSLTLVALSATPPPLPGHVAVVILGREGAHLRRTEGSVPAAHAGPFPTNRLAEHLPVVLEGAAGVVFTAEAGVPLG
jgi:hypothetical protein